MNTYSKTKNLLTVLILLFTSVTISLIPSCQITEDGIVNNAEDGIEEEIEEAAEGPVDFENARLSAIALSHGILSPDFDPEVKNYTSNLYDDITSLTVTPFTDTTKASVEVNGNPIISGSASEEIDIVLGNNLVTIEVTAEDQVTIKTYTITVIVTEEDEIPRSSNSYLSGLLLSEGSLSPSFQPGVVVYSVSVENSVTSVRVTPILEDESGSVNVNNSQVNSGTPSGDIDLLVGDNTITVEVTAEDTVTVRTYSLTVSRTDIGNLSSLELSSGTLYPAFDPGRTGYSSFFENGITSLTITPAAEGAGSTIEIRGETIDSGSSSSDIGLFLGNNIITIEVTTEDLSVTNTYTITMVRKSLCETGFEWTDNVYFDDGLNPGTVSNDPPYTIEPRAGSKVLTSSAGISTYESLEIQSNDYIWLNNDTDNVDISIWGTADEENGGTQIKARIKVLWHGQSLSYNSSTGSSVILPNGSYTKITFNKTPPAGATHMTIWFQLRLAQGGSFEYWAADDLVVSQP